MPTNDEKWAAYRACRSANNAGPTNLGLKFLVDVLTLDIPSAVKDWIAQARNEGVEFKSCYDLLPPEDREAEMIKNQQERSDRLHDRFSDKNR